MIICGIDPALDQKGKVTGIAYIDVLDRSIRAEVFDGTLRPADKYIIETPQMYRKHPRPNDLLDLSRRAGWLGGLASIYGEVQFVKPSEWKRQLKKAICWQRTLLLLTKTELNSVGNINSLPLYAQDDVKDAVGIALWGLGRKVY